MAFIYAAYKDGTLFPISVEDADEWIKHGFAIYRKEEEDGPEDDIADALSILTEVEDEFDETLWDPLPDNNGLYPDDYTGDKYNEIESPTIDISDPEDEDIPISFPNLEDEQDDSEDGGEELE